MSLREGLAVVGAAIGGYFGGPSGASLGWSIGAAVGSLVDPLQIDQAGPRLEDLRSQAGTYGSPIMKIWGEFRVGGIVIWASDLIETKHKKKSGGKGGGPETNTTTYTYSIDCAVAICEGPITGIRRIWANGLLIYSSGSKASRNEEILPNSVRIYPGNETQNPDSLMEAYKGVGNVPGYRGTAYVVFEGLQLEKFGNRLPMLSFEVVTTSDASRTEILRYGSADLSDNLDILLLPNHYVVHAFEKLSFISRASATEEFNIPSETSGGWAYQGLGLERKYVFMNDGPNVNGVTYADSTIQYGEYIDTGFVQTGLCPSSRGGFWSANIWGPADRFTATGDFIESWDFPVDGAWIAMTEDGEGRLWGTGMVMNGSQTAGDVTLYMADGPTSNTTYTIPSVGKSVHIAYCAERNSLIVLAALSGNSSVTEFSLSTFSVVQTITSLGSQGVYSRVFVDETLGGRVWVVDRIGGGSIVRAVDLGSGGVVFSIDTTPYRVYGLRGVGMGFYSIDHDFSTTKTVINFWSIGGVVPLSTVVADICEEVGLEASDRIVTGLAGDYVRGYARTRPMTARAAIEPLQQAYWFDAVESDFKLRFVKRGGASVRTITVSDMLPDSKGPLKISRTGELELPVEVRVAYADASRNYDQNMQYDRRGTVRSQGVATVQLPMVLTDTEAKRIAEVNLAAAWLSRTRVEFGTWIKNVDIDPTDIVALPVDGPVQATRIVKQTTGQHRVFFEGVLDDASIYAPNGVGVTSIIDNDTVIAPVAYTTLFLIDVPPLIDLDEGLTIYAAGGGDGYGQWRAARLYSSSDAGATYTERGTLGPEATQGVFLAALPSTGKGNVFDDSLQVSVRLFSGSLASASKTAVLAGANALYVGGELVQFTTATLTGINEYTLSGFLRGRKGTEWAMAGHSINEPFVLLEAETILQLLQSYADIDQARQYKAVTMGHLLGDGIVQNFTLEGNSVKPLAPVHLNASRNGGGDVSINWHRRTRIDGEWRDGADVGLDEPSEEYEVDIYNSTFTTYKRTISVSAPTAAYSAADQTTDFGSPQSSIGVRIYQISSRIGRGHPAGAVL